MKDKTEADDVFQEAFILLFQKINQYKSEGSFEGWAKRIFINKSLEVLRKKHRFLHLALEESDISVDYNANEDNPKIEIPHEKLVEHIQELPDNYRIVFNLYVFEDYSHKAISEKLDIKIGTSKSLLSRAKARLRIKINEDLNRKVS
jgi:RNA polymerase sigma-70 factor (ECF subfamily)